MLDILESVATGAQDYVELRFHDKTTRSVTVENGRVEEARSARRAGVGVRVLSDGTWGFASTGILDRVSIASAVDEARRAAMRAAPHRERRIAAFPPTGLARGEFVLAGIEDLASRPIEEKVAMAMRAEGLTRGASGSVSAATCRYVETFEDKAIVTSDGARARFRLARPEFRISAVAGSGADLAMALEASGVTGGWACLFDRETPERMAEGAARTATDLLGASYPEGGPATVILSPSLVGLLAHEAIGHTVEADFVLAGSVAAGKVGTRVGSDLVTIVDSGVSDIAPWAAGQIPVDDEGVPAGQTIIIKEGILVSYLHNRESAAHFEVAPTGNARAWEYSDPPIIRMRNTYLAPGESTLAEMIASTEDGYLLDGPMGGQADSSGEFMFGVQEACRIRGGRLGERVRGVTISGVAFKVLATVDAVSSEFRWDLGAGYCGKFQPAKVDAGGPYVRCRATIGGESHA